MHTSEEIAYIPMQRNRKHGSRMQFETFIDEYVSQIAKYINTPKMQKIYAQHPSYTSF